jgi:3-oxoacyl-[acyl-carrier protein] reductase
MVASKTRSAPKNPLKGAPKGAPKSAPKSAPKNASKHASKDAAKQAPKRVAGSAATGAANNAGKNAGKNARHVLVTGGSRGLGLAIAQKLAAAGYHTITLARRESDEVAAAIAQAKQAGQGALSFVPFDLGKIDDIPELVRRLRNEFGPLYGLINNAALGLSGTLALMHHSKIDEMVRLNTVSPIVLTKYVLRGMMADGSGRIVNVASIVASTGASGIAAYAATKASMVGFTRSLAREVGPLGITVNAVAPGIMETDMTQVLTDEQRAQVARRSALNRLAEVGDVADTIEFLLSERARNITGTVITVDAGATA